MLPFALAFALLAPPPADFRAGVSLGLFASTTDVEYQEILYGPMLEEIAALGATDVQLVVRWVQPTVTATRIAPKPGVTPPDAVVAWAMKTARRLGLRVFVLPIVHLSERGPKRWRGTLRPTDLDAWWASYERFVLHYARLCADANLFAVGSELVSQERHVNRWRRLIADVRGIVPGQLTYSANWDHFEPVRFWDALDLIGVSAYWPLARRPGASVEAMTVRWAGVRRHLDRFAAGQKKRYVLTEVGYPSHALAAVRPWDHGHRGRPDLESQRRAWAATRLAWQGAPRLAGIFAWNWFGVGGPRDTGYTPRDKPAAQVLEAWFSGASPARSPGQSSTARSPSPTRPGADR